MVSDRIVPSGDELKQIDLSSSETLELIQHAEQSAAADSKLTIRQALAKYKKACFWAMLLSVSLVMEGYDVVVVSSIASESTCECDVADMMYIDHLVLRPNTIPEPLRTVQSSNREKLYHCLVAIWLVQLGSRWPAGWPAY